MNAYTRWSTLVLVLAASACGDSHKPAATAEDGIAPADRAAPIADEARAELAKGQLGKARELAKEALRLYSIGRGATDPATGRTAELLADIEKRSGDVGAAEQALLIALGARAAQSGASSPAVAEILERLGDVTLRSAPDRAATFFSRALAIESASSAAPAARLSTSARLGTALLSSCRAKEAKAVFDDALTLARGATPPEPTSVVRLLARLSRARTQLGDRPGAEKALIEAVAAAEPLSSTDPATLAAPLTDLAHMERKRQDFPSAEAHAARAVALLEASKDKDKDEDALIDSARVLAATLRSSGKDSAVTPLFERLSLVERTMPPGAPEEDPPDDCARGIEYDRSAATSVLQATAEELRGCYNAVLREHRSAGGRYRIVMTVAADGSITRVWTLTPASFPEEMVACPMKKMLRVRLPPPPGGGVVVNVPVVFRSPWSAR